MVATPAIGSPVWGILLPIVVERNGRRLLNKWTGASIAPGEDGHFVVFDVPAARRHVANFLRTLAYDGRATLVP